VVFDHFFAALVVLISSSHSALGRVGSSSSFPSLQSCFPSRLYLSLTVPAVVTIVSLMSCFVMVKCLFRSTGVWLLASSIPGRSRLWSVL
jgi:hypothetical protein